MVTGWLRGPVTRWGETPVVGVNGQQCTTVEAVNKAVRGFWVDEVFRRHAGVDATSAWKELRGSGFGDFIPRQD